MFHLLRIILALLVILNSVANAREGYIRTRAGAVLEGHLRFESNAVVVVNLALLSRTEVALTNLTEVVFRSGDIDDPLSLVGAGSGAMLAAGWVSEDIGWVAHVGETVRWRGAWKVRSSATNALGVADACQFFFKATGDRSELVGRVTGLQRAEPWARAGLMIRESMAPGARHVFLSVTPSRGGVISWRERYSDEAQVSLDSAMGTGWWLKLKRDGNQFTALKSRTGLKWTLVDRWAMPMAKECYVGLAVTGNQRGVRAEAIFDGVEEGVSLRNRWYTPQVELTGGSTKSAHIDSMDDRLLHFETRFGRESIPRSGVTHVRFQPVSARGARELSKGRRGVLLASGEFVEGECRSIEQGRLVLSSVPLGLKRYDVNSDLVAMTLSERRAGVGTNRCEVRMEDGSVWRGNQVEIHPLGVRLREPTLGWRWLPLNELQELRRLE